MEVLGDGIANRSFPSAATEPSRGLPPHPHVIGKRSSLEHLPAAVRDQHRRAQPVPGGRRTPYNWEVLAIEESGNQTLSSSAFQTQ